MMSGILTTDYLILATIEKFKHLMEYIYSGALEKSLGFGRVIKPLRYRNPSLQKSLDFKVGDPIITIQRISDKERKRFKNLFHKGEYFDLEELQMTRKDGRVQIDGIEFLNMKGFFQQLIAAGFAMVDDEVEAEESNRK